MKKIFLLLLATSLATGLAFAQEQTPEELLNSAIELANSGNEAFEAGSPELALEAFQQSLALATQAGEVGASHVETCKTAICNIYLKLAKDAYRAKEWDKAVELFNQTKEVATTYGNENVAAEAESLIVNTQANKLATAANEAKKNKDFATAAELYKQMVEMNPTNGAYLYQLADAYYRLKDWDNAVQTAELAKANGQERNATSLLSKIYLSRCQASLQAKNNAEALEFANKSNEYVESGNAYKLGASAARALNKLSLCEEMYLKYLELTPNAKDASDIKVTLAESYRKAGNKAKAREYFQMLVNDPKYGATAKQILPTLK